MASPQFPSPYLWNRSYRDRIAERASRRIETLEERLAEVTAGRVIPTLEQVAFGTGRNFNLAIMFLDICGFTKNPQSNMTEQKAVLGMLDIFMAEMMNIAHDHGGAFEKNTGDGVMAYFGEGESSELAVHRAVDAALVMHYFNDALLTPWRARRWQEPIRFRVTVDYGNVTIAKIGFPRGDSALVAIGSTANIANRLLEHIPEGGICLGNEVYRALPPAWQAFCAALPAETGFVYLQNNWPYPIWRFDLRLWEP